MPWLLQPKSYTQIARPNLYNVAYRRVGAYKGMGRLHPTNYLQIGYRPNIIGATTGQYSTLSGQLSLLPPSLRGLGQGAQCPSTKQLMGIVDYTDPCQLGSLAQSLGPYLVPTNGTAPAAPAPTAPAAPAPTALSNYLPWIIGGALFLVLLTGARR